MKMGSNVISTDLCLTDHPVSPGSPFQKFSVPAVPTVSMVRKLVCKEWGPAQVSLLLSKGSFDWHSTSLPTTLACGGNFLLFYLGEDLLEFDIQKIDINCHSFLNKNLLIKD